MANGDEFFHLLTRSYGKETIILTSSDLGQAALLINQFLQ